MVYIVCKIPPDCKQEIMHRTVLQADVTDKNTLVDIHELPGGVYMLDLLYADAHTREGLTIVKK